MKEAFARRIEELAAIDGVAGFEQDVVAYMAEAFRALELPTEIDRFGNLVATRGGSRGSPSVMIAAHADEIGAMVRSIDERGFIWFEKIGGTQDVLLPGRMVRVNGVFGVVGTKAGHLMKGAASEVPQASKLYVDVGTSSRAETEAQGIRVGDPIAFVGEVHRFANPDLMCGKAMDNRVSCAMLLQLFEDLQAIDLPGTLYGVVNVQEEIGWQGIRLVGAKLQPDAAIVVDTVPSGDTPDTDFHRELAIRIGGGPVIPVMSGDDRWNYIMPRAMKELMIRSAEEEGIPYQLALFPKSGSDAITLHMVGEGIPTAIVNIARRNAHSPVEVVDLNDVVNAERLLRQVAVALATEAI